MSGHLIAPGQKFPAAFLLVFFPRDPRRDVSTAPGGGNQPDRYVKIPHQLTAEEETAGAEGHDALRCTESPARTVFINQRFVCRHPPAENGIEYTQLRAVRFGSCRIAAGGTPELTFAPDRHLHVGLSGTHPDITDQNIVQYDSRNLFITAQFGCIGAAGFQRRESGMPDSVGISGSGNRFPGKCYGNAATGVGSPRKNDWALPLQYHM